MLGNMPAAKTCPATLVPAVLLILISLFLRLWPCRILAERVPFLALPRLAPHP